MANLARDLSGEALRASKAFAAIVVTGPRRSGKTTLLRALFPSATYRLLEDPDVLARVRADPRDFIDELKPPVILDEIQNAPELFSWVRTRVDASPRRKGQWLITGSQDAPLMQGVSESMAGRAAVFQLLPLSTKESPKVTLLSGGYPESALRSRAAQRDRGRWFSSYVQTYLERDVRAVTAVRDLSTFRRFLALLATRCGQMINRTYLAAPLGVSVPTISQWLSVLETTSIIALIPPYFESAGKRIVKNPKLHFIDSGLACHLLGIETEVALRRSPFHGPLFEGFVASEIMKQQLNAGRRRELYWFRDHQGLEVDFVIPELPTRTRGSEGLVLVEAKSGHTVRPEMADSLIKLAAGFERRPTRLFVVHGGPPQVTTALRPGASAVDLGGLLDNLASRSRSR